MFPNRAKPPHLESLRRLLAHLSEEEQDAAEARLWRYTELVRSIFLERILSEDDSTKSDSDSRV